jgi:hypothetical protein
LTSSTDEIVQATAARPFSSVGRWVESAYRIRDAALIMNDDVTAAAVAAAAAAAAEAAA